jgi:hypothetical protein
LRQCAAIAVCRLPPSKTPASSAQPAIAASDALTQPQEGHAQANAAGVRRSAVVAADVVAGFGSGLPGMRTVSRFSPGTAETSFRKWPPRGRRSIRHKCPPQTAETRGQLPFSAAQSPRRACFCFETAHRAVRAALRLPSLAVGADAPPWKDSDES